MVACMREGAVLGPGTGRGPAQEAWYLPLGERGHMMGAACVRPALADDESGREHAHALCALLAQALWRLTLTDSMLDARSDEKRQPLQNPFLSAITTDCRTHLAAIEGDP